MCESFRHDLKAKITARRAAGDCKAAQRTLLGGYRGEGPPPTMARMLLRKSISTMPMPPLLNSRRIYRGALHEEGTQPAGANGEGGGAMSDYAC